MTAVEKKTLRARISATRLAIDGVEKDALDAALCHHIAALPAFQEADALLLYLPMRGEPALTPLLQTAKALKIPVYLPRCTANGMRFLLFEEETPLTPDQFGIPAPPAHAKEAAPTVKSLCLVPGLAADRQGNRLGWGGGFYDRFLPRFAGYALFPLYSRFVFDCLPHNTHDIAVPHIITEKGEL